MDFSLLYDKIPIIIYIGIIKSLCTYSNKTNERQIILFRKFNIFLLDDFKILKYCKIISFFFSEKYRKL